MGSPADLTCEQIDNLDESKAPNKRTTAKYRVKIIVLFAILHAFTLYALVFRLHHMKMWTHIYTFGLYLIAEFGTTAGAHRLWTHRSYKAKEPLRLILFVGFALASHLNLYTWVKIHRLHHKYTDTEADPHNSSRGFFFSHIGWLIVDKTPECHQKEKEIDMSDLLKDPLARIHSRYFYPISVSLFFLPSIIPIYIWGEGIFLSILASGFLRYFLNIHCTLSVNSVSHMFGYKPYDKRILPTDGAIISMLTLGEGWHNYHHTFPWDYRAGEFGDRINPTARILDLCAKLGWAYDLKTASPQLVARTKAKYGEVLQQRDDSDVKQHG